MASFDLFIDTDGQALVGGVLNSRTVSPPSLFQGDTPTFNVRLLKRTTGFPNSTPPYTNLGTAGFTIQAAIGDKVGIGGTIYTQQFAWAAGGTLTDPFFTATIPLNTAAVTTLIGAGKSADTWLEIQSIAAGIPTTVLEIPVTINASVIKPGQLVVPPGQTAISAEEINANFLKRLIIGAITMQDPISGTKVVIYVDATGFHADISP